MAVDHIGAVGRPASLEELEGRSAEEPEPLRVIVLPVDASDPKVAVFRLEENGGELLHTSLPHFHVGAPEWEAFLLDESHHLAVVDAVVLGEDALNLVPFVLHGSSKGSHDVSHPSDFGDRGHLDSHVDDLEALDGAPRARGRIRP